MGGRILQNWKESEGEGKEEKVAIETARGEEEGKGLYIRLPGKSRHICHAGMQATVQATTFTQSGQKRFPRSYRTKQ